MSVHKALKAGSAYDDTLEVEEGEDRGEKRGKASKKVNNADEEESEGGADEEGDMDIEGEWWDIFIWKHTVQKLPSSITN